MLIDKNCLQSPLRNPISGPRIVIETPPRFRGRHLSCTFTGVLKMPQIVFANIVYRAFQVIEVAFRKMQVKLWQDT